MTRFSEALKRPVMTTTGARSVGSVHGFVVDPVSRRVLALRLAKTPGSGDTVLWDDLTAFGPDAVTLPTGARVTEARGRTAELVGKDSELVGKRLLTDGGAGERRRRRLRPRHRLDHLLDQRRRPDRRRSVARLRQLRGGRARRLTRPAPRPDLWRSP